MAVAERPTQPRPKPFPQRGSLRTHFLRLPRRDWPAITQGHKTEVRLTGPGAPPVSLVETPTPVVGYSPASGFGGRTRSTLLVCEGAWREPLGSISQESLAAEGFETLADFRRYWKARHVNGRFNPLASVACFRLRPWRDGEDEEFFGALLLDRLYLSVIRDGPRDG